MERIDKWYSKFRIWVPISIAAAGLTLLLEVTYMQSLVSTGLDPLAEGSGWAFEIPYLYFTLFDGVASFAIIVLLMGFMLRSSQLIKNTNPSELKGRPGWAIWGFLIPLASFFLPFQILSTIQNFAKNDIATAKRNKQLLLAFWIPYALLNYFVFFIPLDIELNPTYSDLVEASWTSLAVAGLSFISSVFLLWLIPAVYAGIQKRMAETPHVTIDATS